MNDYISREGTIKKIAVAQVKATTGIEDVTYYRSIKIIREMPSADVQPVKRGRWIISNIYAQCSECSVAYDLDTFQRLIPMNENVPRHCSYCGARMEQED